ncbi:hypothetical protein CRG98_033540 [Punica granatum]|uniref:Uncharacterized protein n=1 Tax=Punica granatum TaxID=22663 RepID=A0A2I0IQ03_PUNGR|nr:hypothetical protein CRG98_033540 [Punica granatum]
MGKFIGIVKEQALRYAQIGKPKTPIEINHRIYTGLDSDWEPIVVAQSERMLTMSTHELQSLLVGLLGAGPIEALYTDGWKGGNSSKKNSGKNYDSKKNPDCYIVKDCHMSQELMRGPVRDGLYCFHLRGGPILVDASQSSSSPALATGTKDGTLPPLRLTISSHPSAFSVFATLQEPQTFAQARKHSTWWAAMEEEYLALL